MGIFILKKPVESPEEIKSNIDQDNEVKQHEVEKEAKDQPVAVLDSSLTVSDVISKILNEKLALKNMATESHALSDLTGCRVYKWYLPIDQSMEIGPIVTRLEEIKKHSPDEVVVVDLGVRESVKDFAKSLGYKVVANEEFKNRIKWHEIEISLGVM
jgi:hypothetical protein